MSRRVSQIAGEAHEVIGGRQTVFFHLNRVSIVAPGVHKAAARDITTVFTPDAI